MNHNIGVIHQDPSGCRVAFRPLRLFAHLGKLIINCSVDCTKLPFVLTGADNKEVCDRRELVYIYNTRIARWCFSNDICDLHREFTRSFYSDGVSDDVFQIDRFCCSILAGTSDTA